MPKRIEIIVSPTGEIILESKGYSGADCMAATKAFEEALGNKQSDKKTIEYFKQSAGSDQKIQQ